MGERPNNASSVNWGPTEEAIKRIHDDERELVERGILPRHDNIVIESGGEKLVVILTKQDN